MTFLAVTAQRHSAFKSFDAFLQRASDHTGALKIVILCLIALVAFGSRLFSVIRFESIIHEFDPWFNYRATQYLVDNGWYSYRNWFDQDAWYPLGRAVGGTVFPGIMATSAIINYVLNDLLHFPVSIRDICVFLAPVFSGLTAVATYFFTKELKDSSAGLLAAAFVAICPGYISRSVAGSYDNEAIAIFLMMATFYTWIRAQKKGSAVYAGVCAMFYFYMVASWGGYVFLINLIPLHVFTLLLMGRYNQRLYVAYSTFYVLGTLASMTVPFVNFTPTRSNEHMAALGVFGLLQLVAFMDVLRTLVEDKQFRNLTRLVIVLVSVCAFGGLVALTASGHISHWTGRFYSIWDPSHAKKYNPIIASVSEHQPTAWGSFFFDLQMLLFLFPAGLYFCLHERRDEHIFAILYSLTASYFAGVMVRLVLTLAPIVCSVASIAFSSLIDVYSGPEDTPNDPSAAPQHPSLTNDHGSSSSSRESGQDDDDNAAVPTSSLAMAAASSIDGIGAASANFAKSSRRWGKDLAPAKIDWISRAMVLFPSLYVMCVFVWHCTWVTSWSYSSPSVVLSSYDSSGKLRIIDDFREAYYWLRKNTPKDAKVMAWWDYGYQLAGMADRPTIVDNNTWNTNHIAVVGKAMAMNESDSYRIMRTVGVDYVLVIAGAMSGFGGDDINKFLWMVRIAQGEFPKEIREADYLTSEGAYRIDEGAPPAFRDSLLYKMSYTGLRDYVGADIYDRARQISLGRVDPKLHVLEEAYSSSAFIVRLFRVKKPDALGRPLAQATAFAK